MLAKLLYNKALARTERPAVIRPDSRASSLLPNIAAMFFNYDHLHFLYEPFPIGMAKPLMDESTYQEFLDHFPALERFDDYKKIGRPGSKHTLSEKENPRAFNDFIRSDPLWREFHRWIKSDAFVYEIMDTLKQHHLDLGYKYVPPAQRLLHLLTGVASGRLSPKAARLRARFEFSAMSAEGGHLNPHTDAPSKIVTLVISMMREGEWDPAFGGGTDVNRPKDDSFRFNQLNRLARFEDMEIVHTYEYSPNQAVIFVKTYNSWHSVRPMTGPPTAPLRKTLTINIERFV